MASDCELNTWEWKDRSFPFAFPQAFDGAFFARFGSDRAVRADVVALLDWLAIRTLDCIAYEETVVWPSEAYPKLSLHVFPPDEGVMFGGFAFEWERRRVHAMALWHRKDPMDPQRFVQRALPETIGMAR